ncbi:MAG: glycosyltransferase family 2 protein [Bacteroidota bacterium]
MNAQKQHVDVAVVIINYDGMCDTLQCLSSLAAKCDPKNFCVILVNNDSSVSFDERTVQDYPFQLTLISNCKNIGFARACNMGIKGAWEKKCEYVFLLNNDTVILDDIIGILKKKLSENIGLGIIGAVNYYYENPEKVWVAGINMDYRLGRNKFITEFDAKQEKIVYADYVPGSSMMIRSKILEQLNGLDEKYFAYWEEIDFCFRARKLGYRVAFLSNSKILHKVGKSSSSALKLYLRTRNKLYFYKKNFSFPEYFTVLLSEILAALTFSVYNLVLLRPLASSGYFFGVLDFLKGNMGSQRINYFLKPR